MIFSIFSTMAITYKGRAGTDVPTALDALIGPYFLFVMGKPRRVVSGHISYVSVVGLKTDRRNLL